MFDYNSNIRRIKQVCSMIIDGLDLTQNIAKIVAHFIPPPVFLTSGATYLTFKIIVLMLTEFYIYFLPVLLHPSLVFRVLQEEFELIGIIYTLRHHVRMYRRETHLGHQVRPFLPVCILVPARIGRPPEANSPLCHMVRPSPREGK